MVWDDLRVFLQVARTGQIVAAARLLDVDHSTISRRIARLERKLGTRLFGRAARRIRITQEGSRLLAATEKLESIILREVVNLRNESSDVTGLVRIGTLEGFAAHYLAPRLAALMVRYPKLEIELVALPRNYSLAAREVDLAITMDRPTSGNVRFKKLTDFSIGLFGAKSCFRSRKRPSCIDDLKTYRWCGYIPQLLFTEELDMLKFGNIVVTPTFRTTSVTVQLEAISGGSVLGILPCFMGNQHRRLERLLRDEVKIQRTYWLAVHDDIANIPHVRAVIEAIEIQVRSDKEFFL
jgi:DNA-binding transcriptional LysR family regulator